MQKLFFLGIILLANVPALCQKSTGDLCQGNYYTEKKGADQLSRVAGRIHDLRSWNAHADSMKRQILKGLELEKFPVKTPLNASSRKKKILDGYSVEAVAFESLPGFFVTGTA